MIPLALKPKLLSLKNRWRHGSRTRVSQDLLVLMFCLGLVLLIYVATRDALLRVQEFSNLAYLSSARPLGMILLLLFGLLFLSSLVLALGALYFSSDLEILISSPLSQAQFFYAKFMEVFYASSWMPVIFMLPFLLAFGTTFNADWSYYLLAPVLIVPFFVIPTALALLTATLLTAFIPASRTREITFLCLVVAAGMLYLVLDLVAFSPKTLTSAAEIFRLVSVLSMPSQHWLPSYWLASCLRFMLEPGTPGVGPEFTLLIAVPIAVLTLAYLSIDLLHEYAYSRARNIKQEFRSKGAELSLWLPWFTKLPSYERAVINKELKLILRDLGQLMQLLMLLVLCLIYLYNLKIFRAVDTLPETIRLSWKQFLLIGNVAMGSFVTTAVCTRFVFPSLSLEGSAYWILLSSPIRVADVLRIKFWFWFTPISLLSASFFAAGTFAIGAPSTLVITSVLAAFIICYGIVGLGIGTGAYFANFDWEHHSQLTANFGSFLYMLLSIFLILLGIVPTIVVAIVQDQGLIGAEYSDSQVPLWLLGGLAFALLIALNLTTAKLAIKVGERALLKRLN